MMKQDSVKLFFDCDPGIDDAMALFYAYAHPQVDVVGAVASGGNVSTEQIGRNLRGILAVAAEKNRAAEQTPWELGAQNPLAQELTTTEETHGPLGTGYARLPQQTEPTGKGYGRGAHLWVETVNRYPGQVNAVVLGPSTNLALALELDPDLPTKLASLYIMGGALNHRGNTMPTTEWNVHSDPEALHRVLAAFDRDDALCQPVLCPLDQTEKIVLTPEHRARLTRGKEEATALQVLDDALQFYMEFHEWDGLGFISHVHDPYVTALAVNNALKKQNDETALTLGTSTQTTIDVELDGRLTRGQTIADWLGRWERKPNAHALTSAEAELFFDHYIKTVRAVFAP